MISVKEAKRMVSQVAQLHKKKIVAVSLLNCVGKTLARPIKTKCASPPFNQSAMDGYAVCLSGKVAPIFFKVVQQEIKAGEEKLPKLKYGEAARIYTGAPVPKGADIVVPQEFVLVNETENTMTFQLEKFKIQDNIRLKGEQFKKHEIILKRGEKLSPANIALAATGGIEKIEVYAAPVVTIISSGNELCKPGVELNAGQVYDSNSYMLASLLQKLGIQISGILYLKDNEQRTLRAIEKAVKLSDVLLISGGISVGKYDLMKRCLDKLKTKTIFYKINQKPGKPLYFGKNKGTYVFGLPGNPAASLTCFYEYVKPFLEKISGNTEDSTIIRKEKLLNSYSKKKGMTYFMKGFINQHGVEILKDQESFKLTSFSKANCIVVGQEDVDQLHIGEMVECHLL